MNPRVSLQDIAGAKAGRTIVIGSAAPTPTGAMVSHPTTPYPELDVLTGRLADVSKARELIGFKATHDLEEGIAELIGWWRSETVLAGAAA